MDGGPRAAGVMPVDRQHDGGLVVGVVRQRGERVSVYELRVKGRLDQHWAMWFEGLTLTYEGISRCCAACSWTSRRCMEC
jgi:hypothetical protein